VKLFFGTRQSKTFIFIPLALLLWAPGCGYHFVGQESPSHHPTGMKLYISFLSNETQEPLLEKRLSHLISKELLSDGRIQLVNRSQNPNTTLKGKITSFRETPLSFNQSQNALEYRVTLTLDLSIETISPQKVLWEGKGIQASAEYISSNETLATREAKNRAILELGKNISETILFKIFEDITLLAPQDKNSS